MKIIRDSKGRFMKGCEFGTKLKLDSIKIIDMYLKGLSARNIAKEFNCSFIPIFRILKENNIPMRNKGVLEKGNKLGDNPNSKKHRVRKGEHKSPETEFKKGNKINLGRSRPDISGDKSYFWKGGISFEQYPKEFNNNFKRAIRKRDNHICMNCGIHSEKLNRALDIHHIDYNKKLSILQNCVSLCHKCHILTNQNRKHWTKFFQSLLSERYDYKYKEGEIILNFENGR